jgi:hypothetical protein
MQIQVIDIGQEVSTKTAKGGYTSIEVTYKDNNNKVANKKLMSFGNAEVYKVFKNAKKGDILEVTSVKDDNGYWQWVGVGSGTGSAQSGNGVQGNSSGNTKPSSSSSYETKEERASRQVLICKQSSLAQAVASLKTDKGVVDPNKAIEVAQQYTDWVMGLGVDNIPKDSLEQEFDNDVPN